jgi:uroporphyrinogen-III synthase
MTFGVLNRDENYFSVAEPLLPLESSAQLTQEAAVTTVTFFSGASTEAVADVARERLRLVLKSNPWIAGKVVKDAKKYGKDI